MLALYAILPEMEREAPERCDFMPENRKLAAILVTDIVGFSRLTGADEEGTLARLRTLRSDVVEPSIDVHNGRVATNKSGSRSPRRGSPAAATSGSGFTPNCSSTGRKQAT